MKIRTRKYPSLECQPCCDSFPSSFWACTWLFEIGEQWLVVRYVVFLGLELNMYECDEEFHLTLAEFSSISGLGVTWFPQSRFIQGLLDHSLNFSRCNVTELFRCPKFRGTKCHNTLQIHRSRLRSMKCRPVPKILCHSRATAKSIPWIILVLASESF